MATYVAVPVLAALSIAQAAGQHPCEGWTTTEFWRAAGPERVRVCLATEYSVHDKLGRSWTVLHIAAAFSNDPEVIALLVEAGADLEASWPPLNRTPLHTAARYAGNPEIVRVLLRYGADANAVNGPGRTPLHLAATFNENPLVVDELAKVTEVNIQASRYGETPLHDAVRRRSNDPATGTTNPAIVETLLRHGADLSTETRDGSTPLRLAEDEAVVDLIVSETQRRAAIQERFLRTIGTKVVVGAVVLTLLGSLFGVGANRFRSRLGRSKHEHV